MKTINILKSDWSYPVCQHPEQLIENMERIHDFLFFGEGTRRCQVVGIGMSGAMLLGAFAATSVLQNQHNLVLIRKTGDDTAQGRNHVKFNKNPIVILDDHITEGKTLSSMAMHLHLHKVKDLVIGVTARSWKCDGYDYFSEHQNIIERELPTAKFWGY